ncbi:MAG TPA: PAS domain S-box protein [Candidatus Binatia bacterium]
MNLDFRSDINKEYAAAMNYGGVDRFMVAILWWHFGAISLLTFTNSFLKLASYFPSPFAWRVISLREALGAILVGWAAALIPALLRGKIRDHYVWRVLVTVALTTYSYLFVFVSGGSIEMHFHFFMIMALLVIYSDWRLGWIVLVLTALHHVILNYLQPQWVYFYGRNDFSVVAHLIPVMGSAIFTTLLCQNNRRAVEVLEHTKRRLENDILERMRVEEALRASEERWRAVYENSVIGVALTDLNGRFLATNSAYQKMLGYTEEEIRKLTFLDLTHEDYRESNWKFITELLEGKRKQFQIEKQYWRKDGSLIWVSNNVSLVPGTENMPRFIMALSEDITARKRADEELRRSEAYLAEAQRLSHTGSWAWNVSTGEVFWSRELFRIFGLDPERTALNIDLIKKLRHPGDRSFAEQTFNTAVRENKDFEMESRIVLPDGSIKHVHTVGHPAVNDVDELVEFVGTVMDVTERRQGEEALRRAQGELAHVTRVTTLGEMTASIAHEVNQPLSAVVNNASACLRWLAASNQDEARQSAALIIADAQRASEIIGRIRAFVKKAPPQKAWLNINETILEVIALARSEVEGNRVSLQTQLSDDVPLIVGDRIQLQQVVLNLINNAIEAMSGAGEGARELQVGSAKDELQGVLVAVRDSGPGLDPESLNHIFTAFYTTKPQGMGMGLAISRSIIEAHGGRLWATANEGRGAVFQFTLPKYEQEA